MLAALAAIALMQCGPEGPIYSCPATSGSSLPAYSFALAAPQTACACAADPRLTVTSGATFCVLGNEWTGIQPGDLVECAANRPRWMPGGDGSGALGLQIWRGSTNAVTRSQDFSHADWVTGSFAVAAPTVTANACLAPDNTMTADLVHFPAVAAPGGPQYSFIEQTSCNSTYNVRTVYARTAQADGGTWGPDGGVITGHFLFADGRFFNNSYCEHTSAGYARCRQLDTDAGQIGTAYYLTVDNATTGALAEQYFCLWQADCQSNNEQAVNPWPPPIPTGAVAVTRAADVLETNGFYFPQWADARLSATMVDEVGVSGSYKTMLDLNLHADAVTAGNSVSLFTLRRALDMKVDCQKCSSVECQSAQASSSLTDNTDVAQCSYGGARQWSACVNGAACGTFEIDAGMSASTNLTLGSQFNGTVYNSQLNGVLKSISVSSAARKDFYLFGDEVGKAHTSAAPYDLAGYPQYPIHYDILGNAVSINNQGDITGLGSEHCLSTVLTQLNYVVDAGLQPRSYFLLECGLDSVADAGGVISDLQYAVAATQDAGVHMLWSTITPHFAERAIIESVNATMTSWCTGRGVPVANTYSALESPASTGNVNPAYSDDAKHLNNAGYVAQTAAWLNTGYLHR